MHPAFGNFMNDSTAQMGFQMGKTAMMAGSEYMEQNVRHERSPEDVGKLYWNIADTTQINRYVNVSAIKHYFNVTNSYVVNKLFLVLFPFRHKPWIRKQAQGTGNESYFLPPREDINSPDMYIPGTIHSG